MTFDISKYVEFDTKGRAQCPSCLTDGKTSKNLSLLDSGAYKCHRGCLPQQIKDALGYSGDRTLPPPSSPPSPPPKNTLVTPQKVKAATEDLLTKSTHALRWLTDRGITSEMIQHYRLGVVRAKVGDSSKASKFTHLPAIAVSIPNADGTGYYQKKRIRPWVPKEEQPDGYQAWSQYGIPRMVYTTHRPEQPTQTWLAEGEWDAMLLGHFVRNSELANDIQVSCFTCGAGNVPQAETLEQLPGTVTVWYDLDEPGQKGAQKVGHALRERCKIATVPHQGEPPEGWDVSDALNAGLWAEFATRAAEATQWTPPKSNNPLRERLVTNDELLATAPDYTDWLVDDILTADELFLLAASPRAGKSLLAFTLTKERQLKQGWAEGMPVYWLDKFKLNELNHLEELVEELQARLVVFDTLSRIRDSAISESSAEMSQLLEPLQEMCKRQRCTGLLVHHTGKVNVMNAGDTDIFETIRGSSAIRATCRGTMVLAADERNYRLCVENGWNKMDLQILLDANTLEWRLLGNWHGPDVDLSQRDRVLAYLTQVGSAKLDQIAEETNLPKRSLYEVLKRLQSDDLVEKRGDQRAAVYIKKALQQVQQLNSLLNSQNPDDDSVRGQVQQNIFSSTSPEKVILNPKSDQIFDHFSEEGAPPTPGDLLNSEPKPLPDKGFALQQKFNTESTRLSKGNEIWLYCAELETAVRLEKKGVEASRVYVPGMGSRQFNNDLLKPIDTPAVELSVELEEPTDG